MEIHIQNIDKLIFEDKKIQKEFPLFKSLFDQWLLGVKSPVLRFLTQKSRLELLEGLNTQDNIAILSNYFNEKIVIRTIDYHISKSMKSSIEKFEKDLVEISTDFDKFCLYRNSESIYMTAWK